MKLLSLIHHIKRVKDKNHMPIPKDEVEAFGKNLHPLILKTLQNRNLGIAETHINIVKALFDEA